MIRINLLPPELRRGTRSADPHLIGTIAACVVAALAAGFWAWLHFVSFPGAQTGLARLDKEQGRVSELAAKVEDKERELKQRMENRDALAMIVNRRMDWAKPLDDLANLLSSHDSSRSPIQVIPGYEVRVTDLAITTGRGAPGRTPARPGSAETLEATVSLGLQMVGDKHDMIGNYLKNFFQVTDRSPFWQTNGFIGTSESTYTGDTKAPNPRIQKTVVPLRLSFTRQRTIFAAGAR